MNPITHLLAGWVLAESSGLKGRDRKLVAWVGVLPDLDGAGMVVDALDAALGRPVMWYYGQYHHLLLHGLPGALLLALVLAALGVKRTKVFLFAFLGVHLHLLCDLIGARGPEPDDLWPIHYLAPFFEKPQWVPTWQWPLNAWPNVLFTILLMVYGFYRANKSGYSPLELFGKRLETGFVRAVQNRFSKTVK